MVDQAAAWSGCFGLARGDFCALAIEDVPGQIVQPILDALDVCAGEFANIRTLWNKTTNQTNDMFDCPTLPGAVWMTVVGTCTLFAC
jgi:hypothetical protein